MIEEKKEVVQGLDEVVQGIAEIGPRATNKGHFVFEDEDHTYRIRLTRHDDGSINNMQIFHGRQSQAEDARPEILNIPGDLIKPVQLLLEWSSTDR